MEERAHNQIILEREGLLAEIARLLGEKKNVLVVGDRKSGKTTLVRQLLRPPLSAKPVVIDLRHIPFHPEYFSLHFIHAVLRQTHPEAAPSIKDVKAGLEAARHIAGEKAWGPLLAIKSELEKIRPDQEIILKNCFSFVEAVGRTLGQRILLVLENIDDFAHLDTFTRLRDVFSLLNLGGQQVQYVFTSSLEGVQQKIRDVAVVRIPPFSQDEIALLLGKKGERRALSRDVHGITHGQPYASVVLCSWAWSNDKELAERVRRELSTEGTELWLYCNDVLEFYFSRVRGQTLLRGLIDAVAADELRLSDIARKIYRSAPVTKSLLAQLVAIGLVEKKGKTFALRDRLLAQWLRRRSQGDWIEHYLSPAKEGQAERRAKR